LFAERGVLGEESGDDDRCGINLLLKSLTLLPDTSQLSAEAGDLLLLMLVVQAGGASAEAVVPLREDGGCTVHRVEHRSMTLRRR
jgi:hypothetical protein